MKDQYNSFFRKKNATARVFYNEKYSFLYNNKTIDESRNLYKIFAPIKLIKVENIDLYNAAVQVVSKVHIYVKGGGISSQLGAARSALIILLLKHIPLIKNIIKSYKLHRWDLRRSERTKPGISGSRVRPPFNKR